MSEIRGKSWDDYWSHSDENKGLFEVIAKFYRRYVISPTVRHYFRKYFTDEPGRIYLHAGCGSAESDNRIGFEKATFVMMDISTKGLAIARQKTKFQRVHFVCGDIFHPPFREGVIDGAWNLGVMEHFYEDELLQVFTALSRVLKNHSRCVIFWPPKYGLSVIVLTSFLGAVNKFRKTPLVLYPDEVSRYSSRPWVQRLVEPAGLHIIKTHFGPRDAFTYAIMVAEKDRSPAGDQ
ncbi:MAG TPA: class I SAM-dependent methyltransferase [Verrucomicrobiae bacterium]|nr:class I SAM-dependent methyltransferase [Verrucomicrobiae bacterium]